MHEDSENIVRQKNDLKPLEELQDLVLGLQPKELETLQSWLKNREKFTQEISDILPQAVIKSVEHNDLLAGSLMPVVEDAIFRSVQKNPKALADALFPIMGPAIRQSIADTFRRMIQSLNETLENQFSPERIKWRIQAMFSSQSYAEIVLLKGLQFKVLSVLLIHKETGLLLEEAHAENTQFEEADMVSSMLTAIQDFAHDSFASHLHTGDTLDTIRLHDFNVWIEDGPFAYLAVVFEGEAPESNRELFKNSIERIHRDNANLIQDFDGDTAGLEVLKPVLQDCVISQDTPEKKSNNKRVVIISIAIFLLLSVWIGFSVYKNIKWNRFVADLESKPSVVIINQGKESGKYFVRGMKDNLAQDYYSLALEHKLDTSKIVLKWTDYISLAKPYYLKRVKGALQPDSFVEIFFENDKLIFKGKASSGWIKAAKDYCSIHNEVAEADFSNLQDNISDSILWVVEQIEKEELEFNTGVSLLNKSQKEVLNSLTGFYNKLKSYRSGASMRMVVVLDDIGSKADNQRFAKQRLNSTKRYLKTIGLNPDEIETEINIASKTNKPRTLKFKIIWRND